MKKTITTVSIIMLTLSFLGCSEPLTTREKGAAIGTFTGAGLGAIIGSATGNTGAGAGIGAAIGAAIGLLGGAVIGDQLQAGQNQDAEVQRQMAAQQAEIERQRRELDQLKAQRAR